MANQLCLNGYHVEQTTSDTTSSAVIIQCERPSPPERVAQVTCPPGDDKPRPKPECTADYQCTATGSQCVKGACVAVPTVAVADQADRCMVGRAGVSEPVAMFPSESALAEFVSATPESRAAAFMTVTRLDGVWVDVGVRCRTLGQFARGRHVQLISGTFAGREGWLQSDELPPSPSASSRP
jgi:hypothetical protein